MSAETHSTPDFEFASIIHASLAGLARNVAESKGLGGGDDYCRAIVASALEGLYARDLHLLAAGDPHAACRAADAVMANVDRLTGLRDDWNNRLFDGEPLRLADLINVAQVAGFGHAAPEDGTGWTGTDRFTVILDGMTIDVFHDKVFLHRNAAEGPAITVTAAGGQLLRALYLSRGVLHRPCGEGPAMLEFDAGGRCVYQGYYEHGKLHRDPGLGPALHYVGPTFEKMDYAVRGVVHRASCDGPALIMKTPDGVVKVEYLENGISHRPSLEGPAFIETDASGRVTREFYKEQGKLHRDPKLGPARRTILADDGRERLEYFMDGIAHRDEAQGPAWIEIEPTTGVILDEQYFCQGVLHRLNGPAVTSRTREGVVLFEAWLRNGEHDRDQQEGPAVIFRNEDGSIFEAKYYRAGELVEPAPSGEAAEEATPC